MLKFTGIGIHIKVKDITASRKFYEALGFSPIFGYGSDDFRKTLPKGCPSAPEKYQGVTYRLANGAELEIADGHIAAKPNVFQEKITSGKISAMIKVESIVPVIQEYRDRIKFPVRHYYWNSIEVALRDPDGFVLVFIAPFSETELGKVSKIIEVETVSAPS
ncbi:MAG TPA: VOC family protein [Candidatus Saccharimonadales bacterium]|nr:VOC family protein [Candidatus Saccharimonadales bacterium]